MSYRQGDILLIATDLPKEAKQTGKGRIVLAVGETTGHKHQLTQATLLMEGEEQYVQLDKPTELTHEEHAPIQIPQGTYRVIHQVEYQPGELRRVTD